MSLPRYEQYKDSGVEWLGEVPAHWKVDRFKRSILSCKNGIWGDEAQENEDDIPCVRVADFDRVSLRAKLEEPTIRNVTEKERSGRVLNSGDLLLEKSGGGDSQPVGCVVLYDDSRPAVCSNFVARVQLAAEMSSSFWRYQHAAAYGIRLNVRSIKQTSGIQNLDHQQYFDELAAFPPPSEQFAIAAYLDRETAKIDALVAEQRRLIELLKEKRQAVISRAVTKGLNPDAPMKDSGVEWLGEVPEHWGIWKLSHAFSVIGSGTTPSTENRDFYEDGEVPWVNTGDLCDGVLESPSRHVTSIAVSTYGTLKLFPAGSVVIAMYGATIGKLALLALPATVNQACCVFSGDSTIEAKFIFFWFMGMRSRIVSLATGGGQPNISQEILRSLRIACPTKQEQLAITGHLEIEAERIDTLTAQAQRAIELLQERRAALISAAVTGQIDVRLAAHLSCSAETS